MREQVILKGWNKKKNGGIDNKEANNSNGTLFNMNMEGGVKEDFKKNIKDFTTLCIFKLLSYCNNINVNKYREQYNKFTSSIITNLNLIEKAINAKIIEIIDYSFFNNLNPDDFNISNYELINIIDIDFKIIYVSNTDHQNNYDYYLHIYIKYIYVNKEIVFHHNYNKGKNKIIDKNITDNDNQYLVWLLKYNPTPYIDNIHKLNFLIKEEQENSCNPENGEECGELIYKLLENISKLKVEGNELFNNKKVIYIESSNLSNIINNKDDFYSSHLITIFKQSLIDCDLSLDFLESLIDEMINGNKLEIRSIIKLLINKVKKCYDLYETDNIYLNMSTKEFLDMIEHYLMNIFDVNNIFIIEYIYILSYIVIIIIEKAKTNAFKESKALAEEVATPQAATEATKTANLVKKIAEEIKKILEKEKYATNTNIIAALKEAKAASEKIIVYEATEGIKKSVNKAFYYEKLFKFYRDKNDGTIKPDLENLRLNDDSIISALELFLKKDDCNNINCTLLYKYFNICKGDNKGLKSHLFGSMTGKIDELYNTNINEIRTFLYVILQIKNYISEINDLGVNIDYIMKTQLSGENEENVILLRKLIYTLNIIEEEEAKSLYEILKERYVERERKRRKEGVK
jgi:hypothetical protein